ncbi:MAG: hypothetical protein KC492_26030 [Myxococcales bacterium]|nr:hypothetical protein [Myxococcales bacterium]
MSTLAVPAGATPPQTKERLQDQRVVWAPTVGVEFGYTPERLKVSFPTESLSEDRELWNTRVALGVDGRWGSLLPPFALRTVSELGVGFVHHTGHGLLEVSQAALLEYPLGGDFALPFGAALLANFDTSSSARSSLTFTVPFGLRYRGVELWFRPGFLLPLGSEEERVFTGSRELSARPGINWLDFGLRVRLGFLEF